VRAETIITRIARIEARYEEYDWPWAKANASRIEELWAREVARKPRLFNGIVLLAKDVAITGDTLTATYFPVRFAPFLAFRSLGYPEAETVNLFAMAALCDGDGAFLLGEMGGHTANAGRIFFPGGTPDMLDVPDGDRVDLAGSVLRELEEETSMPAGDYEVADEWHVVREGSIMALMRPIRLTQKADEAARRLDAAIRTQDDPELSGAVVIATPEDADNPRIPGFMRSYMRWRMSMT
jgi:8-oxo-dGTP pyrophosphatase MutT (NUDIX family)